MKKKLLNSLIAGILAAGMVVGTTGCGIEINADSVGEEYVNDEAEPIYDFSALRAQDDYYGYINYSDLANMKINYFDSAAGLMDCSDEVNEELLSMIKEIAESKEEYALGSNEQLIRDAYRQVVEYIDTQESGAKEYFEKVAAKILEAKSIEDIKKLITYLKNEGIVTFFDCAVEQDFYNGESYSLLLGQKTGFCAYEMKDIYENDDTRQQLHGAVMETLVAAGIDADAASDKADDLVYMLLDISFETDYEVMEASNPFITLKYKSESEMNELLENISIEEIEQIYGITGSGSDMTPASNPYGGWYVQDEAQLKAISSKFNEENVENLKTWLLYEMMYSYRGLLAKDYPFLAANAGVTNEIKVLINLQELFPIQLSELYAEYYYTEEMDTQLHRMYEDIIDGYHQLMEEATWLTADARREMIEKLENMVFVCGGGIPHEVDAKDAQLIGKDFFETTRNSKINNVDIQLKRIGTKIDKTQPQMASYEVNACYSPCNTFTITVAIMHSPMFDVNAEYAENMGGLGMVMGHEIGHAFDSNCIYYDENGVYAPDRLNSEDIDRLAERLLQIEEYYSSFTVMDIYHVNGEKTSGENYADKGAMECLMKVITDSDQRKLLFENYARIWCLMVSDEYVLYQLEADEHSPALVRVNAVLSSTPEFYEVYEVKPGDGMYREPENQVSRWY